MRVGALEMCLKGLLNKLTCARIGPAAAKGGYVLLLPPMNTALQFSQISPNPFEIRNTASSSVLIYI